MRCPRQPQRPSHCDDPPIDSIRVFFGLVPMCCTVEKVAVNAVIAGAYPESFPVILALAASGSTARSSSTTSMTNMAVVNGPIRHERSA
jgi:hypothetical protein